MQMLNIALQVGEKQLFKNYLFKYLTIELWTPTAAALQMLLLLSSSANK